MYERGDKDHMPQYLGSPASPPESAYVHAQSQAAAAAAAAAQAAAAAAQAQAQAQAQQQAPHPYVPQQLPPQHQAYNMYQQAHLSAAQQQQQQQPQAAQHPHFYYPYGAGPHQPLPHAMYPYPYNAYNSIRTPLPETPNPPPAPPLQKQQQQQQQAVQYPNTPELDTVSVHDNYKKRSFQDLQATNWMNQNQSQSNRSSVNGVEYAQVQATPVVEQQQQQQQRSVIQDENDAHSPVKSQHHHQNDNSNGSDSEQKKKTRKRLSVSCRTCRKKKIKCDRLRPICGSCSKNNIPTHLCIYDDSPWVSSLVQEQNLYTEIESLKEENKKLMQVLEKEESKGELLNRHYSEQVASAENGQPVELSYPQQLETKDEMCSTTKKLKNVKIELTNFGTTVKTEDSVKTFGPLTWQNYQYHDEFGSFLVNAFKPFADKFKKEKAEELAQKESLTTYLFEYRVVFHVNNTEGKKMDPNLPPFKNDLIGKKLQYFAAVLPSYKYLEKKLRFYFDMHYSKLMDPFFRDEIIFKDFKRIFKKTRKGGVEFNVYEPTRNYSIELAKLAQLFLLIKFGIVFDESNDAFDDTPNLLVRAALSALTCSNCFIQPSIPAINAVLFIAVFKVLNPDDLGDEIFPKKAPNDVAGLLDLAYHMMMVLGLWKSYDEIDPRLKDPNDPNDNFIGELEWKGLWKNLLYIDSLTAGSNGSTLALRHFVRYKSMSTSDICIRQTIFTRFFYGKYSFLNGLNSGSLGKVFEDVFDYSQQQGKLTRLDVEQDLYEITSYFETWVKMGVGFWKEYYNRTADTSPMKDRRLIFTLQILELSTSLNYMLYFSYSRPEHPINGSNPLLAGHDERIKLAALRDQFMNNAILHAVYSLKLVDWSITQELTNEAVAKNKILQVTSRPRFKKNIMNAVTVLMTIIGGNSKADEYGLLHDHRPVHADAESVSLFSIELHELEELCFSNNVMNKNHHWYYNEDFISQFSLFFEGLFMKIRKNDLFIQDPKWFGVFREYFYLVNYFLTNKRTYLNKGAIGKEDFTDRKTEIMNVKEYFEIQNDMDKRFDSQKDFKTVPMVSILN